MLLAFFQVRFPSIPANERFFFVFDSETAKVPLYVAHLSPGAFDVSKPKSARKEQFVFRLDAYCIDKSGQSKKQTKFVMVLLLLTAARCCLLLRLAFLGLSQKPLHCIACLSYVTKDYVVLLAVVLRAQAASTYEELGKWKVALGEGKSAILPT